MDSAGLYTLNEQQFGQILTRQTGGQLYSDTSLYGECSLLIIIGQGQEQILAQHNNATLK